MNTPTPTSSETPEPEETPPAIQPTQVAKLRAMQVLQLIQDDDMRRAVERSLNHTATIRTRVRAFHEFYQVPVLSRTDRRLSMMDDHRLSFRLGFMVEELKELFSEGFGIELDITYMVIRNEPDMEPGDDFADTTDSLIDAIKMSGKRDVVGLADGLGDLEYVLHGFALEAGIDMDAVGHEIHASNMTKASPRGKPIFRSDSYGGMKVMKGPFYLEPNITQVLTWSHGATIAQPPVDSPLPLDPED